MSILPLRKSLLNLQFIDCAENSCYIQRVFFSRVKVPESNDIVPLLIIAGNKRQSNLALRGQLQPRSDAMPVHVYLCSHSPGTNRTSYLQGIWYVLHIHRDDEHLCNCLHSKIIIGSKREETLYTKGKTTGLDVTWTANSTHKSVVAPSSTQLHIETILVLSVDLKDQACVVAYTAS